jgi:hypothetical protein
MNRLVETHLFNKTVSPGIYVSILTLCKNNEERKGDNGGVRMVSVLELSIF